MKRILKFSAALFVMCAVIFWCGRIYSVNNAYKDDTERYDAGAVVAGKDIEIRCMESHIYSVDEYKNRFGDREVFVLEPGDRLLCACLNVKNTSDGPLSWDYVMDCTLEGFESVTWCGSVVQNMGQGINVFRSSQLDAGAEQDIWYVTSLARVSFRQKTWDNLKDEEFWYVPTLEPVKIMMKLKLDD